jgi:hypothetical protein
MTVRLPAMINDMADDDSRDAVFGHLLDFLNRLDQTKVWYRLGHTRPESVVVEIALPGWRWEVEFMANGAVEIERFQSLAGVEEQPELLDELFTDLEGD